MKALVFNSIGDISLQDVAEPRLMHNEDVIVQLTTSSICGTDLHFIRGSIGGVLPKTILGHEGVGIVEQVGSEVSKIKIGDRVIIPSTICCGRCHYCQQKIFSQCDRANPNGPDAGTALYGGPASSGPFQGMQAEKVRVPFADYCLVKIGDEITDEAGILISDILPTAYMAIIQADITPSETVALFGCGPVGQLIIALLKKMGVEQIFAIDRIESRLIRAEKLGATTINSETQEAITMLKHYTKGKGPEKIIDAVGVDAQTHNSCSFGILQQIGLPIAFQEEVNEIAPQQNSDKNWQPGNCPSLVLSSAVIAVAKAGTISIAGVYPPAMRFFPIGIAMNKNLTLKMGVCNHRAYMPLLIDWIIRNEFDVEPFITHRISLNNIVDAYTCFNVRKDDWLKVMINL